MLQCLQVIALASGVVGSRQNGSEMPCLLKIFSMFRKVYRKYLVSALKLTANIAELPEVKNVCTGKLTGNVCICLEVNRMFECPDRKSTENVAEVLKVLR